MLNFKKGFTALEILIVLAILGVVLMIVLPQFAEFKKNQVLENGAADIISALNKARSETLSSLNSSEYGVHFQSDKVIIFKGTIFSTGATDNQEINITSPARISAITLSGGADSVYFNMLSASPSSTGSIVITNSTITKTITISATGIASLN